MQAGPTPPELLVPELPPLLVPELPLVPLVPELPELLVLVPELPLEDVDEPESGFAESATPLSTGVSVVVFCGSFAPTGSGSAGFTSSTASPSPSSGEVAHAEMRATSDRVATAMRLERRMAGTVAAEVYPMRGPRSPETLR